MKYSDISLCDAVKRVSLCLLFCVFFPGTNALWAAEGFNRQEPVELFMGGKHYGSLESYREARTAAAASKQSEKGTGTLAMDNFGELRSMFDEARRTSKNPAELKFDPTKMKTFYFNKPSPSG